jgi:D-alanyl-lipoteichoic acid acyltransferase DltB (MBOAT superfamily)
MLALSLLALYWLQPATPIRNLDFWLPTASLALTAIVWAATIPAPAAAPAPAPERLNREAGQRAATGDWLTAVVVAGLVLAIALTRYLAFCCITPSRPPDILQVLVALAIVAALAVLAARLGPGNRPGLAALVVAFILLFVVLKAEPLARGLSAGLRTLTGQSLEQASALDIRWLGFSYLAFRLIHALRERMLGKLPGLTLQEFLIFAVFFPALTAGPIDRVERFVKDLRAPFALSLPVFAEGGWRTLWGIFKKFALADTLALIALNDASAAQTRSAAWTWVLLYAYAFRIYFDFSGYTDIALGLGRWAGVKLPENFDRPYLKQNLTLFWNSWHITLAQWFRAYYFNPLTRLLRGRPLPPALIIFLTQLTTMILIGLWHGITWNFVAWGAWHGLGLFAHNRWSDFTKPRAAMLDSRPGLKRLARWAGVLLTFHFVLLGWVWFALADPGLSWRVIRLLIGASGAGSGG